MAVYDLDEQERLDDLKAWWAQYGKYVSIVVIAVSLVVIGVQGWRWYERTQSEQASVLYFALSQALKQNDSVKAKDAGAQLVDKYARTPYAASAALLLAKLEYDAANAGGAKAHLQWVIDKSSADELKSVARYRLAELLLDERAFDEALRALDAKHDEAFNGMYADLKGDVLAAAGKPEEAKAAYAEALAKLEQKSSYRAFVQVKLDSLGTTP